MIGATPETAVDTASPSPIVMWLIWLGFGIFLGAIFGGLGFNAAASIGPTITESGTILSTEIDYGSPDRTDQTRTYFVLGETDSGTTWRFASTEIYDLVEADGLPRNAEIEFGALTGTAVGVSVGEIDASQTSIVHKIGWAAAAALALLVGCAAVLVIRKEADAAGIVSYLIGFALIGAPISFFVLRAFRNG